MNTLDALATDRRTYEIAAKVMAEVASANPMMSAVTAVHLAGHVFFALRDQALRHAHDTETAILAVTAAAPAVAKETVSAKRVRKSHAKAAVARMVPAAAVKPPALAGAKSKPLLALRSTDNPAVPMGQSLHDDFVVCLEDGTKHIMMKRHLRRYGLTAEQYIERWSLPEGYPLVAPSYSLKKLEEARRNRLGSKENKSGMKASEIAALEALSASRELVAAE